jgi:hypothetical protein
VHHHNAQHPSTPRPSHRQHATPEVASEVSTHLSPLHPIAHRLQPPTSSHTPDSCETTRQPCHCVGYFSCPSAHDATPILTPRPCPLHAPVVTGQGLIPPTVSSPMLVSMCTLPPHPYVALAPGPKGAARLSTSTIAVTVSNSRRLPVLLSDVCTSSRC